MISSIVVGVLSSFVASALFLIAIRMVKPSIDISPVIAEIPASADPRRRVKYQIKVINRSRRPVTDLAFELIFLRPSRMKGGEVMIRRPVAILGPPPLVIGARRPSDKEAHNAYRVSVEHDLKEWLVNEPLASIRLRVIGRDAITGVGELFEQTYHDPSSDLQPGHFAKGQTFEIVP